MGYIGKTDEEVGWDREEAQRFKEHDLSVWASGEPKTFFELVNGKQRCFRKVRVQNLEGTIKGILGYEIDYRYDDCQ